MTTLNRSISEIYETTHLMFAHTTNPLVELEREDKEKQCYAWLQFQDKKMEFILTLEISARWVFMSWSLTGTI